MQELEILGMEVGTVAVQPWAGLGEQTTGQKAGQQLEPLQSSGSIQHSPVPFLHRDPGQDPPSFHPHGPAPSRWQRHNECKWAAHPKSLCTDTEFQAAFFEGFVLHCKSIQRHCSGPAELTLHAEALFLSTERGGLRGQEGAVAHGSWQLCDTAFCTAGVFHGMNCSGDGRERVYLEHSSC